LQFGESTCDRVGNSLYFKHEVDIGKDRIDEVKHADLTGSEKKLFIGAQNKVCEFERKKVEIHKGYQKTIDSDLYRKMPRVEDLESISTTNIEKRIMN